MARQPGRDCKLYYQAENARAAWNNASTPALLTEIPTVRDVSLNLEKSETDASTRGSAFEEVLTGLIKAPLEFEIPYNPDDDALTALKAAYLNDTAIPLLVADGDIAAVGTHYGVWADFQVTKHQKNEALDGADVVSLAVKPSALSDVAPQSVTYTVSE